MKLVIHYMFVNSIWLSSNLALQPEHHISVHLMRESFHLQVESVFETVVEEKEEESTLTSKSSHWQ